MITLDSISYKNRETLLLRNINAHAPLHKKTVIVGSVGQGKTILLKIIAGLHKPHTGTVTGVPQTTSYLFQNSALLEEYTVAENIALGFTHSPTREEISQLLKLVHVDPALENSYPLYLSPGVQKKIAVARALAQKSELLLIDSPTEGLDPLSAAHIRTVLYTKTNTSITISHDPIIIENADWLWGISEQTVVYEGPVQEALHPPTHTHIRALMQCMLLPERNIYRDTNTPHHSDATRLNPS